MRPPISLLVVGGGGSQVVRLQIGRWLGWAAMAIPLAIAAGALILAGTQALVRFQRVELASLRHRVADQAELIEGFRTGVSSVRSELAAWSSLHASMWESLGPEWDTAGANVGGAPGFTPTIPTRAAGPRGELELLVAAVAEEGPRLRELELMIGRTGRVMDGLPLRWPVRGRVNSGYGRRPSPWGGLAEFHDGLDISVPPGTPIRSPAAGKVVVAGGGGDYGRHVILSHGHGVRSLYGHLAKVEVKPGQRVQKGDVLGLSGSSGRSTGPHLHYGVMVDGKPMDPRKFLWAPKPAG